MTILAWISSNLEAFTFLGQNNVTNLGEFVLREIVHVLKYKRTSKDVAAICLYPHQGHASRLRHRLCDGRLRPTILSASQLCHLLAYRLLIILVVSEIEIFLSMRKSAMIHCDSLVLS
jgi:hypothetical protein